MPATCQRSSGSVAAGAVRCARSRRARRRSRRPRRCRALRRRGSPSERRAQRGGLLRDRLAAGAGRRRRRRSRCTPRRSRSRRARPRRGGARAATRVSRPNVDVVLRQRERDLVDHEARDLLDEVDLARHVARAPRRHADSRRPSCSKPRLPRIAACSLRRRPRARARAFVRSGRSVDRPRARAARLHVACARSSARRRARRSAASRASRPGPARYGSTPFSQRFEPSVRSASRSDVRSSETGSKFAASSSTDVVCSETSVSSPPMIPASAIARSASAISEIGRLERAHGAVERAELLALLRAAHDDAAAVRASRSRTRAAGCRARA